MSYKSRAMDIINRCGNKVKIFLPQSVIETTASIQPLMYKSKSYFKDEYTSAGVTDDSRFLYIGPSDIRVDQFPKDTIITDPHGEYVLKSSGKFCCGDEIVYIWAVLQSKKTLTV